MESSDFSEGHEVAFHRAGLENYRCRRYDTAKTIELIQWGGFRQQWFLYASSSLLDSSEIFIMPGGMGAYIFKKSFFFFRPNESWA